MSDNGFLDPHHDMTGAPVRRCAPDNHVGAGAAGILLLPAIVLAERPRRAPGAGLHPDNASQDPDLALGP
jgi:hypothetical protein